MRKIIPTLLCASLLAGYAATAGPPSMPSYKPVNGYVPEARTAIQIAVAICSPIYGERKTRGVDLPHPCPL